jgi:hypothetical protein
LPGRLPAPLTPDMTNPIHRPPDSTTSLETGRHGQRRRRATWFRHIIGAITVVLWTVAGIEFDVIAGNALRKDGTVGDAVLYAVVCSLGFGMLGWILTARLRDRRALVPGWSLAALLVLVVLRQGAEAILRTAVPDQGGVHFGASSLGSLRAWVPSLYLYVTFSLVVVAIVQRLTWSPSRMFGYGSVLVGVAPHLTATYLILRLEA